VLGSHLAAQNPSASAFTRILSTEPSLGEISRQADDRGLEEAWAASSRPAATESITPPLLMIWRRSRTSDSDRPAPRRRHRSGERRSHRHDGDLPIQRQGTDEAAPLTHIL
jgi:hypothetical protein